MDDYEKRYMQSTGAVLFRHKAVLPRSVFTLAAALPAGLAGVAGLGLLVAGVVPGLAALAIVGGGVLFAGGMSALLALTGVVRVIVSEEELLFQIGTKRVQISVSDIDAIEVRDARVRNRGIGVRLQLDGTRVYSMLGDPKRAVHITREGHPPMVLVLKEPEALVDAVRRAQSASAAPRVRVGAEQAEEVAVEDDVEDNARQRRR